MYNAKAVPLSHSLFLAGSHGSSAPCAVAAAMALGSKIILVSQHTVELRHGDLQQFPPSHAFKVGELLAALQPVGSQAASGGRVMAQYSADKQWYAAKCIAPFQNGSWVSFTHYGNREFVPSGGLRPVTDERWEELKLLGFPGLDDPGPVGTSSSATGGIHRSAA